MKEKIKLIECPRDAMQGWPEFIPTQLKIEYLNELLKVGFDTLDFGSFVSPKAIPQMADTVEVLDKLEMTATKLLAIIANERGAEQAVSFDKISYLGFPFSISETFQQRNANSTIDAAFEKVSNIRELCGQKNKHLVVYISMGFGNPYGDEYNEELVYDWIRKITGIGVKIISIADTVGLATSKQVAEVLAKVIPEFPGIEIGVHLHSTHLNRLEKLEAAFNAGCRRFDGAIRGIGGCPMAGNDLIGNMDTEFMVDFFESIQIPTGLNKEALRNCSKLAQSVFK